MTHGAGMEKNPTYSSRIVKSFPGKNRKADSYEEYVFDIDSDELAGCEVMGEFWTCNNAPIHGSWQVTFPISQ